MNIFNHIKEKIILEIQSLERERKLEDLSNLFSISVEPPREISHGDMASNAAMVLAKANKMNPKDLAEILLQKIKLFDEVDSAQIAGPGFINMRIKDKVWQDIVVEIQKDGVGYGNSNLGKNSGYNIEYVSANPTGPLHIGHSRGSVYGDALATLLIKVGHYVTKEYYINDAGAQIDKLAKSAFIRYCEALGENIGEIPAGLYPGEYLKIVGESLVHEYGRDLLAREEKEWLPIVRKFSVDSMMIMIKEDLADLGIHQDVFTSEKAILDAGKIEEAISILDKKDLIYQGVLEPPKGKTPEDWEPRKQTLFKATQFGDDVDRPLKKSDGSYTYFAGDIAYHLDKIQRGATKMAIVLGADHGGYIKRLQAAVKALSDGAASIDVKICQIVNFIENGQPMKMSKRAGTFTTVRDVINEVGKDVIRFIMLTRKNDAPLDFDLNLVKEQSKDNPIFYVQYAHARVQSVLRNAHHESPDSYGIYKKGADLTKITHPDELHLIKIMASWPRIVESAAIACEPHRIAFYLQDLAASFHSLWNKGKEDATIRFIIKDQPELTAARLAMLDAFAKVLASGLLIFNIEPVMEM